MLDRPKIAYIPKGLTVDYEKEYARFFDQEVNYVPENREDFLCQFRLSDKEQMHHNEHFQLVMVHLLFLDLFYNIVFNVACFARDIYADTYNLLTSKSEWQSIVLS